MANMIFRAVLSNLGLIMFFTGTFLQIDEKQRYDYIKETVRWVGPEARGWVFWGMDDVIAASCDDSKTIQYNEKSAIKQWPLFILICKYNFLVFLQQKSVTFSTRTRRFGCAHFCDGCLNTILSEGFCLCTSLSAELELAGSRRRACARTSCQLWGLAPAAASRSGPELPRFFCR